MALRREEPHTRIITKSSGEYHIPNELHASIHFAITEDRQRWWDGIDIWGSEISIRLFDIVGLVKFTADSLARWEEEEAEIKTRRLTDE